MDTAKQFPREDMEGKAVPRVTLKARKNGEWSDLNTDEFFADKTVVLFALPGAFTPTCSSTHLPRYEQLFSLFKANGVDEVVCLSVNDAFVMDSWGKDQKIHNTVLLPDGNCEFTRGMNMQNDLSVVGFGWRSWRYSMLVTKGKITKIFAEPVEEGDPFKVSDAETMLKHINPKVEIPPSVVIFSRAGCTFCEKAKASLENRGFPYEEVLCGLGGSVSLAALPAVSGSVKTPQVFIDGKLIGGSEDLEKFLA